MDDAEKVNSQEHEGVPQGSDWSADLPEKMYISGSDGMGSLKKTALVTAFAAGAAVVAGASVAWAVAHDHGTSNTQVASHPSGSSTSVVTKTVTVSPSLSASASSKASSPPSTTPSATGTSSPSASDNSSRTSTSSPSAIPKTTSSLGPIRSSTPSKSAAPTVEGSSPGAPAPGQLSERNGSSGSGEASASKEASSSSVGSSSSKASSGSSTRTEREGAGAWRKNLVSLRSGQTRYVVASGDTLSELAEKMGTSVSYLAKINDIDNPDLILVGQALRVPAGVH